MTNPDLPVYVDLELYRANEQDLVDAAIAAIRVRIPEWVPQEGNTEVLLIEAIALLVGQEVFAINRLATVVFDALLGVDGLVRKPALAATGQVQIVLASMVGATRTLLAGTRFRVQLGAGLTVDVLTSEDVAVNPGDGLTADLWVTAAEPGARYNDTPAGTPVDVVDPLSWIESAHLSTPLTGGAEEEPDLDFYSRGAAYRRRQGQTLVTADQFATAALDVVGVERARAVSAYDPVNPQTDAGDNPGHITVAVAGPSGSAVTAPVKLAVTQRLSDLAVAGLQLHIVDRDAAPVVLDITVTADPTADLGVVEAAALTDLAGWLNPDLWAWGAPIWENDVIVRLGGVPGVRRVVSVGGAAVTGGYVPGLFTLPAVPPDIAVAVTY